jgi:hypothetical protein
LFLWIGVVSLLKRITERISEAMKIIKVKARGRELQIGDIVTDPLYMKGEPQKIIGFSYVPNDRCIVIQLKSWPTYLNVDSVVTLDEIEKNKVIAMLEKRCEYLHQERLKGAEAIGKLCRIPDWIKWCFGAI